jgi:hypothetical protein
VRLDLRPLERRDAEICDAIVLSLPYHFGQEAGRRECAEAVRSSGGFVAENGGEIVAFLTWEPRFDRVVAITWLAVREGRPMLIALTVSATDGPDDVADGYEGTRAFYTAMGFEFVRDLPGLWGTDTPMLMARVHPASAMP